VQAPVKRIVLTLTIEEAKELRERLGAGVGCTGIYDALWHALTKP
jgi:hypothetical protein